MTTRITSTDRDESDHDEAGHESTVAVSESVVLEGAVSESAVAWDVSLAEMLGELASTQDELLAVLSDKRNCLARGEMAALGDLQEREERVLARLQACHDRRANLLSEASAAGLPSGNLRQLAGAFSKSENNNLGERVKAANAKMDLLRHQSLTNWVLAQRALVHLSQLIEIIATGGRLQPTYGDSASLFATGNLMDQAV
jgi:flagellar biosynthesis/type III secretory pathway chaperone